MVIAQDVALKLSVAQTEILQALTLVSSAVPSRTTLPVLSNILLEAKEGSIQMTATDLDLAIATRATADITGEGSLTVPAKRLFELVRKLPKEELKLESKDLTLNVVSKTGRFKFLCIRPEEFPARINVTPDFTMTVESKLFERMIRRSIYAVSTDETRPALNGALFQISDGEIRLVATDGHRLARAGLKHPAASKSPLKGDIIIPLKALNHLLRLFSDNGDPVRIELSKNHARFTFGTTTLTTKLIEGPFPNYEQVLPEAEHEDPPREERRAGAGARPRLDLLGQPHASGQVLDHQQQAQAGRRDPGPGGGDGRDRRQVHRRRSRHRIQRELLPRHLAHHRFGRSGDPTQHAGHCGACHSRAQRRGEGRAAAGGPPLPRDAAPTRRLIALACGSCRSS